MGVGEGGGAVPHAINRGAVASPDLSLYVA